MMWKWWVEKSDVTIRRIRRCGGSQPNILPPPFSSLLHNHCSTHCKQTQIQATTTMYVWPKWTKHHSHQDHSLFHIHYEFFYLPSLYYVCVFGGPLLESCTGGKRQIQARFHSHKRSLCYTPKRCKWCAMVSMVSGGLVYSHDLQTCDWPRNVACKPIIITMSMMMMLIMIMMTMTMMMIMMMVSNFDLWFP